ncbi:MAG: DEAD/DEAH box helicase [Magnetococcales bacterium]|nr:DEAD/DEAH box helicase [Magnetococcales bacterium]
MSTPPNTTIDPTATQADERLARYHALSPAARMVMGMKALIGSTPVTRTVFYEVMLATRSASPEGKAWNPTNLSQVQEDLRQQELLDDKFVCPLDLLHPLTADLVDGPQGNLCLKVIQTKFPVEIPRFPYAMQMLHNANALRQMRLALYTNDDDTYSRIRALYEKSLQFYPGPHFLIRLFLHTPIALDWLLRRTPLIRYGIFLIKLNGLLDMGLVSPSLPEMLAYYLEQAEQPQAVDYADWAAEFYLLSGDLARLRRYADTLEDKLGFTRPALQGSVAFLSGDNTKAVDCYRIALKAYRQHTHKRKIFLDGINGLYFLLALLATHDSTLHGEIQNHLDAVNMEDNLYQAAFMAIRAMLLLVQGLANKATALFKALPERLPEEPLSAACFCLAEFFIDAERAQQRLLYLEKQKSCFQEILPLVAHIYGAILARIYESSVVSTQWMDFTQIVQIRKPWERAFDSLAVLLRSSKPLAPERTSTTSKRLAWFVDCKQQTVEVLEQSFRARQGWSEGRPVAMKRLYEQDPRLHYLTDQDRRALRALRKESGGWGECENYYFDVEKTLLALIGHPTIFDALQRDRLLELVAYPLELVVHGTKTGYRFTLSHSNARPTVFVEAETPTRFRVIEFSEKSLALRDILGPQGLEVPKQAKEQVTTLLREQGLALPIRADIAGMETAVVEGNTTPVLQMRPIEQGLTVSLHVRPFGQQGPCYLPGQGSRSVLATLDKIQQRANRNLEGERQALAQVYAACPMLPQLLEGGYEGAIEGLEPGLDLLLELQACPHPVVVEWPESKPLRVCPPVSAKQMVLHLKQSRDWFQVQGEVRLDQGQVVALENLLERLDQARGRFIPLDDGRFVTLTSHFRHQLERLRALTESAREGRKLATLGAIALQELVEETGELHADRAWNALSTRIQAANASVPEVPSTLQAELRDYQVEGFLWLSRLARWGAGACLADDMGLGKTVQAIAILLEQAPQGPCLVVAPTSVCHNWEREMARFAPVLNVHRLSATADRAALLAAMGPMDVLVVSYGLLQGEGDRLAEKSWQVLILDEAQAIKNAETRRAQASRKLNAAFRIALSGTPIENYLEELWSLFQVINPHLLGSKESFQKRFAGPIEKNRDATALQSLRALVRPFILRRTKSMVLAELPARTDVTLEVELPDDERLFHEALRQKALATLAALAAEQPGQQRFRILAEITRLRQACCHPGLVDPETTLPGAKLTLFLELAEELIRNRHKALVFSQFVGHLDRVRAALDAQGIPYQYLDGSTPAREREKRVTAFQSGTGDLFLISLKAGGLGLNLTAADYVIHLDPWWNPAVEDQASDRAHRIGQNRPVTVYRLIVRNSIEEKMLTLHQDKRDLADALLEGTDTSVRLSEDDLLALIRG